MMDLKINGGTFTITDDNKTIVSSDIAKEILDSIEQTDEEADKKKPELIIKD